MNTDPSSAPSPGSPTSSDNSSNHYSEVPTEPLPASEILRWNDHMTRRKHFLSDYERYNPVQNMHALANHVFDLSESVHNISDHVTASRRTLGIVQGNTREMNDSLRNVGEELSLSRREMAILKSEVDGIKGEVYGIKGEVYGIRSEVYGIRSEVDGIRFEVDGLKGDVEGLKGMIEVNRREIGELRGLFEESRRETQQGFAELKGMMQMLMGIRA